MADQTSVSGNGSRFGSTPAASVVSNLADFGSDVATLAELQARLLALELKQTSQKAMVPVGLLAGAVALLLACLPVALIGASELLASAMQLSYRGWAYLIVAGIALVIGLGIAWAASTRLGKLPQGLNASKEELSRNIAWIRTVVLHSGRPAPRGRR
jgi:putative superfamily III holin-X